MLINFMINVCVCFQREHDSQNIHLSSAVRFYRCWPSSDFTTTYMENHIEVEAWPSQLILSVLRNVLDMKINTYID